MELGVFLGLLGTLVGIVLPMTGWAVRPTYAKIVVAVSLGLIVVSIAPPMWGSFRQGLGIYEQIAALLDAPIVQTIFLQGSLLLAALIAAVLFLFRPMFKRVEELQKQLVKYVLPRHLTEDQIQKFCETLKKQPGKIILRAQENCEEASSYRADFYRAFDLAGWEIAMENKVVGEGTRLDLRQTMTREKKKTEGEILMSIVQQAFREIRVRMDGTSTGSSAAPVDTVLTLEIGRRRMDDGHERARQAEVEDLQRRLKNPDYDQDQL
ncbi:MAG: hypothetical protein JNJ53_06585 [Rhizobiales bacterium]|nr:hypothetical protein [Hyphomicrobiales bacterium]